MQKGLLGSHSIFQVSLGKATPNCGPRDLQSKALPNFLNGCTWVIRNHRPYFKVLFVCRYSWPRVPRSIFDPSFVLVCVNYSANRLERPAGQSCNSSLAVLFRVQLYNMHPLVVRYSSHCRIVEIYQRKLGFARRNSPLSKQTWREMTTYAYTGAASFLLRQHGVHIR